MMSYKTRFFQSMLVSLFVLFVQLNTPVVMLGQQSSGQSQDQTESGPKRLPLDYLIGPGDILSIRVFQQPELGGDVRVSAQGYIRLFFIKEPIKAAGYNEWELADVIKEKLLVILRDPQVAVEVREGRQEVAYVLGSVASPKQVSVNSETRLLNMIAAGGGLNENAGSVAYILRSNVWSADNPAEAGDKADVTLRSVIETVNIRDMFQGKVELNKRIYPGDVVTIPEADKVFVGGSVNDPDSITKRGKLSLTQAILLAGGRKPEAGSNVTIIRQEEGKDELTEIKANLKEIRNDPSKDVALQANDIVFVPSSSMKTLGTQLLRTAIQQMSITLPFLLLRR